MATPSGNAQICLDCIADKELRAQLTLSAVVKRCRFCLRSAPSITIRALAAHVDATLRQMLSVGESEPRFSLDSDSVSYEQAGDAMSYWLQDLLGIDYEPACSLLNALVEGDEFYPGDGEDPFYASDQNYQLADIGPWEFATTWRAFSDGIKHEERFFGSAGRERLARILGSRDSEEARALPIRTLEIGDQASEVFRARRAATADQARSFLSDPPKELGPPPLRLAVAGRMNPSGIAVFYGALSEEVAIAEVRPAVGGIVALGVFAPTRQIRLLDLSNIGKTRAGSIFALSFLEKASRARFLAGFHSLIAQPVQPHDEPLDYLPTQAVAEYVHSVLGLDGILFGSSQLGLLEDRYWEERDTEVQVAEPLLNVAIFGTLIHDMPRTEFDYLKDVLPQMQYPLAYKDGSAHGVWVRGVEYRSHTVDLDDNSTYDAIDDEIDF